MSRLRLTLIAILCLIASLCGAQTASKRWAIVIGIDNYEDTAINALRFAVADAKMIGKSFESMGFERVVTLTTDKTEATDRPTRGSILERLSQIAQLSGPEDTFVFYFSGHGFSEKDESYLTTSDCRVSSLDDTALPMTLLKKKIEKIQASHRVFIIDACRNDPMAGGKSGSNVRTQALSKELVMAASATETNVQPGTAVLWACQLGERSYELEELGHGAFTYYLSKGLESGKAAESDGVISPYSLISYAQDQMESWSLKTGHKQRPDWDSTGKAKFALGKTAPVIDPKSGTKPGKKPDPKPKPGEKPDPKADIASCQAQALAVYEAIQKQDWKALYYLAAFSPANKKLLPGPDVFAQQIKAGLKANGDEEVVNLAFGAMKNIKVGSAVIKGNTATVPTSVTLSLNGVTKHFNGVAKMRRDDGVWKWDLAASDDVEKETAASLTALLGDPEDQALLRQAARQKP